MKTIPILHKTKIVCLALAALGLFAGSSPAQVIGSWQGSSSEGWIDWNYPNGGAGTPVLSSTNFSIASGAVAGYAQSLQLTKSGWNQNLAIKLEYSGQNSAFLNNHLFSITWSVPAGTGGGYEQLYGLSLNASGYSFGTLPASMISKTGSGSLNGTGGELDFWSGSPKQSQTLTWDYSSVLPSITATPSSGWIEFIFASNAGGGAPGIFYFNNAVFSGGVVPEPSTLALMGFGALASLFIVRRKKT
jgi:hypothetical protein